MTGAHRRRWWLASITAFFAVAIAFTAALAIPARAPSPVQTSEQAFAHRVQQHDRLYLGRKKRDGGEVSEEDLARFLIDVAPRVREGFTVLQGVGAWRDADGVTHYERSFVFEAVHAAGAERDDDLREVIAEYKRRFAQDSVLWVRSDVAVTLR